MTLYKLDTFDLEVGMAVYGDDGQAIGTVTEVAGFGSTRLNDTSDAGQMTQAQTGTGYFKVGRPGMDDLCVPFNRIRAVVPGRGVTLTAAESAQMQRGAEGPASLTSGTAQSQKRPKAGRWAFWRS